jgi:hypothetical protein
LECINLIFSPKNVEDKSTQLLVVSMTKKDFISRKQSAIAYLVCIGTRTQTNITIAEPQGVKRGILFIFAFETRSLPLSMAYYLSTVALENNWLLLWHGRSTVDGLSLLSNVFHTCLF